MFPFWKQLEGQYSNISNTLKGEFVNTITHANKGRTEEFLHTTTRTCVKGVYSGRMMAKDDIMLLPIGASW